MLSKDLLFSVVELFIIAIKGKHLGTWVLFYYIIFGNKISSKFDFIFNFILFDKILDFILFKIIFDYFWQQDFKLNVIWKYK